MRKVVSPSASGVGLLEGFYLMPDLVRASTMHEGSAVIFWSYPQQVCQQALMAESDLGCYVKYFMMRWRGISLGLIGIFSVFVAGGLAEWGVRALGWVSFPVYQADPVVGYWPSPSQSGAFQNRNRWYFNERSMGVAEAFLPDDRHDVLLVGDSIVLGGNSLDQSDKLGPRLTRLTGQRYWPLSAGSWSLLNELRHLKRNMDLVERTDALTFVLNSADFAQASSWSCESTHPRQRPASALMYVAKKYLLPGQGCSDAPAALRVQSGDWKLEWKALMADSRLAGKPVDVWLYPTRDESLHPDLLTSKLESVGAQLKVEGVHASMRIRSLARDSRWPRVTYVDAIHPDVQGFEVLSQVISAPEPVTLMP